MLDGFHECPKMRHSMNSNAQTERGFTLRYVWFSGILERVAFYDEIMRGDHVWVIRGSFAGCEGEVLAISSNRKNVWVDVIATQFSANGVAEGPATIDCADLAAKKRKLSREPRVEIIPATVAMLEFLKKNPAELAKLTDIQFEDFVQDRLEAAGFHVIRQGKTHSPDGGVDMIAFSKSAPFPFVLAIQAKHKRRGKIGSQPVRDLGGVIAGFHLHAGALITNTTFSPDAKSFAKQSRGKLFLRDFNDLKRWIEGNFTSKHEFRELPKVLEFKPGVPIPISGIWVP